MLYCSTCPTLHNSPYKLPHSLAYEDPTHCNGAPQDDPRGEGGQHEVRDWSAMGGAQQKQH